MASDPPTVICQEDARTESSSDTPAGRLNLSARDAEVKERPTWHGVLGEVRQGVREGDSAAPAGTGHATGDRRGRHLPIDGGIVGEAAHSVSHGHPPLLWQGRCWTPLPEGCRIWRRGGGGAAQARVVGRRHREGGRGRSLVTRGTALPGQRGSPVLRGGVAAIGHVPIQAGAAGNHRSRCSEMTAQDGASGAGYCVAMEIGGQVALVDSRMPAQAGAPWGGGHITREA